MSTATLTRPACTRCGPYCRGMGAGYLHAGDVIEHDGRDVRVESVIQRSWHEFRVTLATGELVVLSGSDTVHFARR